MIRVSVFAIVIMCFGLSQSSYAQSDPSEKNQRCSQSILRLVGKHFDVSDFENGGVITAEACKVWPKNSAITITAFAYEDASGINGKSLVIAMIDNTKGKIIATYKGAQITSGDSGIAENGLQLDTARYDVAPGIRAFGLDITESYRANCGDGGYGPARTLFVQDGKEIRPILINFFVSTWRFIKGGNPGCVSPGAAEETVTEDISYSIGIGNATTHGYANLLITAVSSISTKKPFKYELHYDGEKYEISSPQLDLELSKWLNAP